MILKQANEKTAHTKASAQKPTVLTIGMARNKNQKNSSLFGSTRKSCQGGSEKKENSSVNSRYFQQIAKQSRPANGQISLQNIVSQLHTKFSIDFINSLYSGLVVGIGYDIDKTKQNNNNNNKQNQQPNYGRRHSIKTHQTHQTLETKKLKNLIQQLIGLKKKVDLSYASMKNMQVLYEYIVQNHSQILKIPMPNSNNSLSNDHFVIEQFLQKFEQKKDQLFAIQSFQQLKQAANTGKQQRGGNQMHIQSQMTNQEKILKKMQNIQILKSELERQKKATQRLEREEKFLIEKLYQKQKSNIRLVRSSSQILIKTTNLKDSIQNQYVSELNALKETRLKQENDLKRSCSVKLHRAKRFNILNASHSSQNKTSQQPTLTILKSARSFKSLPRINNDKKRNYFDKIH